jgi:hypothetical protein
MANAAVISALNFSLDAINAVENGFNDAGNQKKLLLEKLLLEINKGSKQLIGKDIWSVSEVNYVSRTVSDAFPITVKLVNTALLRPALKLTRDELDKK